MPVQHDFKSTITDDNAATAEGKVTPTIWNDDPHIITDSRGNIHDMEDLLQGNGFVNVKDYGAKGDGSTNDTTAINEALAVNNSIYLPKGTFLCNLDLITSNFNIIGIGKFNTVIKSYDNTKAAISVNGSSTYIDGFVIRDLSINGNGGVGLELIGGNPNVVAHGDIRNLQIENVTKGIYTHGTNMDVYKNIFQNIRIIGCLNGIERDSNGAYDQFLNVEIVNVANGGYAIKEAGVSATYQNISVDGCIINTGDYARFLSTVIETIDATTPPDGNAFKNGGNFCTIDLVLLEIDPSKCGTGFYTNSVGNIVQNVIARGTKQPNYLMNLDSVSSGTVQYAYGGLNPPETYMTLLSVPNAWNIMYSPFFANVMGKISYGTAAPTTGSWNKGDRVVNASASAGGYAGWICVTAGTPGTWKGYGLIQS